MNRFYNATFKAGVKGQKYCEKFYLSFYFILTGRKDRVKLQRQILALTYGTMMAFSTAVDFRICTLILSVCK